MNEIASRLPPRLSRYAKHFEAAALCFDLDALVLAALCDRESGGGDFLSTKGPDGVGDGGHGRGLMQIDDRYHKTFIAALGVDGVALWKRPWANILYGASLLAFNLSQFGRDYIPAIASYNASLDNVRNLIHSADAGADRVALVDTITTGHNYTKDVLARRDKFLAAHPLPTV
jgi:hypothetical protein